jgi:hypothetical protein
MKKYLRKKKMEVVSLKIKNNETTWKEAELKQILKKRDRRQAVMKPFLAKLNFSRRSLA